MSLFWFLLFRRGVEGDVVGFVLRSTSGFKACVCRKESKRADIQEVARRKMQSAMTGVEVDVGQEEKRSLLKEVPNVKQLNASGIFPD